ncbi:MAG: Flp family type IVb pilin [Candidatus Methylacidiphilales bacterium]
MMTKVISKVKSLVLSRKGKSGQTLVEYALILAFISVVAIAVLRQLGTTVTSVFTKITTNLQQATGGS